MIYQKNCISINGRNQAYSNPHVCFLPRPRSQLSTLTHVFKCHQQINNLQPINYKWWLRMAIYMLFVLSGESVATLFGQLYYDRGGKSIWMATLAQLAGFPILIPCYCISPPKNPTTNSVQREQPSVLILALVYNISFGIFLAAGSMMYSIGLLYLPVSTFSLICAYQLAFNALFSFLLHSTEFTILIINSLVLLTISSTLLVFHTDSANFTGVSKEKFTIGFRCTVGASAGYGLTLSLTQLSLRKLLKRETYTAVLEMMIYQSLLATCAALVGLFTSGAWKGLKREMEEFRLGKLSYIMTLTDTAIASQVFTIGAVALIFEVSSLFSNVISVLGLPIVPILAVILFHDKIDVIKVNAMVLAIWGFVLYVYQHYLDNSMSKTENRIVSEASELPLLGGD